MTSTIRFAAGEWAWISGASSGIGRATALRLASEEVGVVLSSRREEALKTLAGQIEASGGQAIVLPLDVTQPEAIEQAMGTIKTRIGRLDIVVPCAGNENIIPFDLVTPGKWKRLWEVHVIGAFEMARNALSLLKASGSREGGQGRVIFVSSVAAMAGLACNLPYSACKAAVLGGMRSLAIELSPYNIRANAVAPGMVRGPMLDRIFSRASEENNRALREGHPLGLGNPEDVAGMIVFLASYEARWMTGSTIAVDGGMHSAPAGFRSKTPAGPACGLADDGTTRT